MELRMKASRESLSISKSQSRSSAISKTSSISSSASRKRNLVDFEFGHLLGEGSFSSVLIATEISSNKLYAVKVLDKRHIVKENKVKYVTIEKDVLHKLSHPFCIKLYYTFQDVASLYFVLEYCPNGDIYGLLKKHGRFGFEVSRFYIAEITKGLQYIHSKNILHRDLKPENILLTAEYHIKITDFGSAKIMDAETPAITSGFNMTRKCSFVGTAEYCPPELLDEQQSSYASDIWALGCIIYQLVIGVTPFKSSNEYQIFKKILSLNYNLPESLDLIFKDLIPKILLIDPESRITLEELLHHQIFDGFSLDGIENTTPPILDTHLAPLYKHSYPVAYFDPKLRYESDFSIKAVPATSPDLPNISPPVMSPDSYEIERLSISDYESVDMKSPTIDWKPPLTSPTIKFGRVKKKSLFFSKFKGLVLTDENLLFFELKTNTLSSTITLLEIKRAEVLNFKQFRLILDSKTMVIEAILNNKDKFGDVSDWVNTINRQVSKVAAGSTM